MDAFRTAYVAKLGKKKWGGGRDKDRQKRGDRETKKADTDKETETDRGRNTDGDKTGKYKMEI